MKNRSSGFMLVLSLTAWIAIPQLQSFADVIWLTGNPTPVCGRVVEINQDELIIAVFETKYSKTITIQRDKVEQFLVNIDQKRLSELRPSNPRAYVQYAEELSGQKIDKAARNLAKRLFVIAAFHSDGELHLTSLAGLAALADSAIERRRINALRYLSGLEATGFEMSSSQDQKKDDQQTGDEYRIALELVRYLRQGKNSRAMQMLKDPKNQSNFDAWKEICSANELRTIAQANRITQEQLGKLLKIEISILQSQRVGKKINPYLKSESWGDFYVRESTRSLLFPSIENITAFDPRNSIYKNGSWVQPAE